MSAERELASIAAALGVPDEVIERGGNAAFEAIIIGIYERDKAIEKYAIRFTPGSRGLLPYFRCHICNATGLLRADVVHADDCLAGTWKP